MASQEMRQLMNEVKSIRNEFREIRVAMDEIDHFRHREVRPEYIKKLKKIQASKGKLTFSINEKEKIIEFLSGLGLLPPVRHPFNPPAFKAGLDYGPLPG